MSSTSATEVLESGYPSTLNDQQEHDLRVLRQRVEESEYGEKLLRENEVDAFLLRVLRATMKDKNKRRIFQVEEAYKRTISILNFKEKFNVWEEPEKMAEYSRIYPRLAYRDEKVKQVVVFSRFGLFASNGKWDRLTEDEWSRCLGYELERTESVMASFAKEMKVENKGYISVADAKGVSMKLLSRKHCVQFLANVSGENYPEMLGETYLVNAPWVFATIFRLVSPLLDPQTVSKLHISSDVPEHLIEALDENLLPEEYGGKSSRVVPYPVDCAKLFQEDLIQEEVVA